MHDSQLKRALDGAKLVRVKDYTVHSYVQAWHGGTQVNIYQCDDNGWRELTVWSLSDEEGKPVSREEIDEHMEKHWELLEEDFL